jgi:hypothetical protein
MGVVKVGGIRDDPYIEKIFIPIILPWTVGDSYTSINQDDLQTRRVAVGLDSVD